MSHFPYLTTITFIPFVGALALLAMNRRSLELMRGWTLGVSAVNFVISLALWVRFDPAVGSMQRKPAGKAEVVQTRDKLDDIISDLQKEI